jgi:outer membrane immunogenic protein
MRALSVVFAAAVVVIASGIDRSSAADLPVKARPLSPVSYVWDGFYVGANIGYGFGDNSVDIGLIDGTGALQGAAAAGVFPVAYSFNRDGVVGGVQIGFNRQSGPWVWGVEADIQGTDLNGGQTVLRPPVGTFPNLSSVSQDMDWLGTLRLRAGYAVGNWMFYGTGGLAVGHVRYAYTNTNAPFGGPVNIAASDSKTHFGWTAGVGFEYGWDRWSAKFEYLYYDLGTHSFFAQHNLAPPGVGFVPNFRNDGSIVRVGVNYRLQ